MIIVICDIHIRVQKTFVSRNKGVFGWQDKIIIKYNLGLSCEIN